MSLCEAAILCRETLQRYCMILCYRHVVQALCHAGGYGKRKGKTACFIQLDSLGDIFWFQPSSYCRWLCLWEGVMRRAIMSHWALV